MSSTVYLTSKADREVQLTLSNLRAPAASGMTVNGPMSNSSKSGALQLARADSSESTRHLDNSSREAIESGQPTSTLKMSRVSLLGGYTEMTESPRGSPPVLAALSPVCWTGLGCVSMTDSFDEFDCFTQSDPLPSQPGSWGRRARAEYWEHSLRKFLKGGGQGYGRCHAQYVLQNSFSSLV